MQEDVQTNMRFDVLKEARTLYPCTSLRQWKAELRANNPVAYGDISHGMGHLSTWPECHTRILSADPSVKSASDQFAAWLRERTRTNWHHRGGDSSTITPPAEPLLRVFGQRQDDDRVLVGTIASPNLVHAMQCFISLTYASQHRSSPYALGSPAPTVLCGAAAEAASGP